MLAICPKTDHLILFALDIAPGRWQITHKGYCRLVPDCGNYNVIKLGIFGTGHSETYSTFSKLNELLRFRHFKRYYFEMDFDWRKIELLVQIFR